MVSRKSLKLWGDGVDLHARQRKKEESLRSLLELISPPLASGRCKSVHPQVKSACLSHCYLYSRHRVLPVHKSNCLHEVAQVLHNLESLPRF